jgi:hypothetical protein
VCILAKRRLAVRQGINDLKLGNKIVSPEKARLDNRPICFMHNRQRRENKLF